MSEVVTNKLIISFDAYRDMDAVYQKVSDVIRMLLETECIILAYNYMGNKDCIIIEYLPNIPESPKPFWVTADELVTLQRYKDRKELEECKSRIKELTSNIDDDKFDA